MKKIRAVIFFFFSVIFLSSHVAYASKNKSPEGLVLYKSLLSFKFDFEKRYERKEGRSGFFSRRGYKKKLKFLRKVLSKGNINCAIGKEELCLGKEKSGQLIKKIEDELYEKNKRNFLLKIMSSVHVLLTSSLLTVSYLSVVHVIAKSILKKEGLALRGLMAFVCLYPFYKIERMSFDIYNSFCRDIMERDNTIYKFNKMLTEAKCINEESKEKLWKLSISRSDDDYRIKIIKDREGHLKRTSLFNKQKNRTFIDLIIKTDASPSSHIFETYPGLDFRLQSSSYEEWIQKFRRN